MSIALGYNRCVSITLQSVRAFVAVAECGSFGAAAKRLKISQPSVSAAVARLEGATGESLFQRNPAGVSLTESGQRSLPSAVRLIAAAAELESSLTDHAPQDLTLGFMGEAASSATGHIVKAAQLHLSSPMHLRRFDFSDPTCGLDSGETDLAIVWPPLSTAHLDLLVIASDRRAVAFEVGDTLAARDTVDPGELGGRDWIVPRSPDPIWTSFRHPHEIGAPDVRTITDSGSVEETLELVAAGAGCALLSESTDQHYARAGVVIVPLTGQVFCTAALAWRRSGGHPAIPLILADLRELGLPFRRLTRIAE